MSPWEEWHSSVIFKRPSHYYKVTNIRLTGAWQHWSLTVVLCNRIWILTIKFSQRVMIKFKGSYLYFCCRNPEPFTAYFLPGSDPEFFVKPQVGELPPFGTEGTVLLVGFKPRMYSRKYKATLAIEVSSIKVIVRGVWCH